MSAGIPDPKRVAAIAALDAEFWRLHGDWRQLEDDFEAQPYCPDECEVAALMFDRATETRDRMFTQPVVTAAALAAKLEACVDGDAIDMEMGCGATVFELIRRDCEALAALEIERGAPDT